MYMAAYFYSLAVILGYELIFVWPNVVKDDLRRKKIELLLCYIYILYCINKGRVQKKLWKIMENSIQVPDPPSHPIMEK